MAAIIADVAFFVKCKAALSHPQFDKRTVPCWNGPARMKWTDVQTVHGWSDLVAEVAIAGAVCGAFAGMSALDRDLLATVEESNSLDLTAVARGLVAAGERMAGGCDSGGLHRGPG